MVKLAYAMTYFSSKIAYDSAANAETTNQHSTTLKGEDQKSALTEVASQSSKGASGQE